MKSAVTRTQQFADLLSLAAARAGVPAPSAVHALALAAPSAPSAPPPPAGAVRWLAELMLLYGVPFEYLVPVANMLPAESIRFFFVDQNWTNRLIDGAASVGVASTVDQLTIYATLEQLVLEAALAAPTVRALLLGRTPAAVNAPAGPITGFLLRSAAVSGWPGLEVAATDAEGNSLIPPLRFERLAPDILLCLFNGLPVEVDLKQPSETMHFGVVEDAHSAPQATLRYVSGSSVGMQIDAAECAVATRDGNAPVNVVNVQSTAATLLASLIEQGALPQGTLSISSGQFAIEMVQSAEFQPFQPLKPSAVPAASDPSHGAAS